MGACASKFTVLKNSTTAPPPAVKCEVEPGEVNLVEEVAVVEKDDAAPVDDDAKRRQSLGHLLQEVKSGEEKKGSADINGKASEDVNHNDAVEAKPEAVAADAPLKEEREIAPVVDGLKAECAEEETPANQNVEVEAEKIEDKPTETLKQLETIEKPQENEAVEIPCTDTEPATLESEKIEAEKPASDVEIKKEEEKLAEATELEVPEKTPETPDEISTEIIEMPEKKPEATEELKPASEEKPCEISDKKPESPETEKTEELKQAADADKILVEEKPAENEASDKVEDKHVLEPQTTEDLLASKEPETCEEEQKPAPDAEKPKAEEEKAK